MTRPRIAVTCYTLENTDRRGSYLGFDYTGGVEEAGGLPYLVATPYRIREGSRAEAEAFAAAYAADILDGVGGLLVTGGDDMDPEFFGEGPVRGLGAIEPARDILELALVRAALERGVPLLGICRGIQVLAVVAGGTLYQDLPSQKPGVLKHRQDAPRHALTHSVDIYPRTLLSRLLESPRIKVNSFHHQAVNRVPEGFAVSAHAPDGVVEAIELAGPGGGPAAARGSGLAPDRFVLGVQWHPENLWSRERVFLNLFRGLVEAAGRYR